MNQRHALKHISCKCRCEFDGTKCNSRQKWNHDEFQGECKNQEDIAHMKRITPGMLVHVLASVTKILKRF